MKYIWEACDIHEGRKVDSHNRAERYLIGYEPQRDAETGNLILVSLRDGMQITKEHTSSSLAEYLNESGTSNGGFRPVDIHLEDIAPRTADSSAP
ncbi:TPA: hypothetical protein ACKQHR_001591 [Pseudomonas aeruginosa]|nr:hypothetical protein [Pseudomonas aeruginosa]